MVQVWCNIQIIVFDIDLLALELNFMNDPFKIMVIYEQILTSSPGIENTPCVVIEKAW